MIRIQRMVTMTRLCVPLTGVLLSALVTEVAQSAVIFYQTGALGGGQQFTYAPTTPISGTMTAPVPRFNGGLGTLIQADFEFASSATGTWVATVNQLGTSTLSLSGPADVDGQPMGTLSIGFVGAYDNMLGSNDYDANYANLTVTSGAFFNSLTGVGTFPMNWIYSGNTTLDTPAIGTSPGNEGFSWGGSVHVLYTYEPVYEPVPEPASVLVWMMAGIASMVVYRRRRVAV
jgi:hypothetical protein